MFSFSVLHPPFCKHEPLKPCIQGVGKDWGQKFCSRSFMKNGDWLNGNLSQETIFLATALRVVKQKAKTKFCSRRSNCNIILLFDATDMLY